MAGAAAQLSATPSLVDTRLWVRSANNGDSIRGAREHTDDIGQILHRLFGQVPPQPASTTSVQANPRSLLVPLYSRSRPSTGAGTKRREWFEPQRRLVRRGNTAPIARADQLQINLSRPNSSNVRRPQPQQDSRFSGDATVRPYSAVNAATRATSSPLLAASRCSSKRRLSSRPVRAWPPSSSAQWFTTN